MIRAINHTLTILFVTRAFVKVIFVVRGVSKGAAERPIRRPIRNLPDSTSYYSFYTDNYAWLPYGLKA